MVRNGFPFNCFQQFARRETFGPNGAAEEAAAGGIGDLETVGVDDRRQRLRIHQNVLRLDVADDEVFEMNGFDGGNVIQCSAVEVVPVEFGREAEPERGVVYLRQFARILDVGHGEAGALARFVQQQVQRPRDRAVLQLRPTGIDGRVVEHHAQLIHAIWIVLRVVNFGEHGRLVGGVHRAWPLCAICSRRRTVCPVRNVLSKLSSQQQ